MNVNSVTKTSYSIKSASHERRERRAMDTVKGVSWFGKS
jgi:hypothetical protein